MKYLIAGLGNIGDEYTETRHNIGFKVADALATDAFTLDRHVFYAQLKYKGRSLHIIKPTTYMNLSGKALRYWLDYLKIPVENSLVITDDIALPFGKIRIKKNGSDGGHNGLKSIIESLGTVEFPRLRFGIGGDFQKGGQVNYVLGKWNTEEKKQLDEKIAHVVESVKSFVTVGIERTMNEFN